MKHLILKVAPILALCVATAHASTPSITAGRTLYREHCMSCHRADGRGGVRFSHSVSADLRAPGLERTYRHQDALIERAILLGRDQDDAMLNPPMPHWAGRLDRRQVRDVVAYLHTLRADRR